MIKELEKIQKYSVEILGDYPERRAELARQLAEAEEQRKIAQDNLDAAEDLQTYDKATEALNRAKLAVKFARSALEKLDSAPRMDEGDYRKTINTCENIMHKAVSDYREQTAALMERLKEVKDNYQKTAADVNDTLEKLDAAANVLQSKYPYKVIRFQGHPDEKIRDRNEWKNYALRYDPGMAAALATDYPAEVHGGTEIERHDSVLCAAWDVVRKAYPRVIY